MTERIIIWEIVFYQWVLKWSTNQTLAANLTQILKIFVIRKLLFLKTKYGRKTFHFHFEYQNIMNIFLIFLLDFVQSKEIFEKERHTEKIFLTI